MVRISEPAVVLPVLSTEDGQARDPSDWFLTRQERGNPSATVDRGADPHAAWTHGNHVEPLVHGSVYFSRLAECLSNLSSEDQVFITDWRGDHDERLVPGGPTVGELLVDIARRGVKVRGLLWRSHPKLIGFNEGEASELATDVNDAGGEILLDARVRRGGSHHQKLVLVRHPDRPADDRAFVGGIDLCHGRRDDQQHGGDPQAERLDPAYGVRPPWHDIQAEVRGPAVGDLYETFRERWDDPSPIENRASPLGWLRVGARKLPMSPEPLPPPYGPQPRVGRHTVQVVRTYPAKRPPFPFAPEGERSIARLYEKVLARARSLIYVEDQYFWSEEIATLYEEALRRSPELRLIVVVPRHPDRNGAFSGPANRLGQLAMRDRLLGVAEDRVAMYDLENEHGDAIYVHAKSVVVDDVLAMIGSDNMNRRSWTHDSELSIAVLDEQLDGRAPRDPAGLGDGARSFARDLRLRLWREHLGDPDEQRLLDPVEGFDFWKESAAALDAWYDGGQRGPRPPGRARSHRPRSVATWKHVWAWPLYRSVVDPDGRPARLQREHRF